MRNSLIDGVTFTMSEALWLSLAWFAAGLVWGWASRRKEIERLHREIADKQTKWDIERLVWSRHK